jgi:hypothetical protein
VATLRALLGRLPGLRVRAGAGQLDREVRWVHVSELGDPTPYLRGGELVLTAGVHLPDRPAEIRGYARRLADFGVAGLGFGVAPIHRRVPPALVTACEEGGLPLIEVPPSIPFISISEVIAAELEAARTATLRHLNEAQRELVSAATRLRPAPRVIARLAGRLQAGVMLAEGERRLAAGPAVPACQRIADAIAGVCDGRDDVGVPLHADGQHVLVTPVPGPGKPAALVVARAIPLSSAERSIVRVATSLLSLVARGVPRQSGPLLCTALAHAAAGEPAAAWERPVARALGIPPGAKWRAVACAPPPGVTSRPALGRWREATALALGSPLTAGEPGELLVLAPDARRVMEAARGLAAAGVIVAMSEPAGWAQVSQAIAEARRKLVVARITGNPAIGGASGRPGLRSLSDVVDEERAQAVADAVLAPVQQARPASAVMLLTTLRTWLARHGGWDAAATDLGVHRNTVRNRIALVGRLLGCDMNDPDVRMQLWFALRWSGGGELRGCAQSPPRRPRSV